MVRNAGVDPAKLLSVARSLIGQARYRFLSEECDPPSVVNCISFTSWCWSQCGINIPCSIFDQLYLGTPVDISDAPIGSLVFCLGMRWNRRDDDRARLYVGHVGLYTGEGNVIHASAAHGTVVEQSIENFLRSPDNFRGVYRIVH